MPLLRTTLLPPLLAALCHSLIPASAHANQIESQLELAISCAESGSKAADCPTDKSAQDLLNWALDVLCRAYDDKPRTMEFLARIANAYHQAGVCGRAMVSYKQYLDSGGSPTKHQAAAAHWLLAHQEAVRSKGKKGDYAAAYAQAASFLPCYADYLQSSTRGDSLLHVAARLDEGLSTAELNDFAQHYEQRGEEHASFWDEFSQHLTLREKPPRSERKRIEGDADGDGAVAYAYGGPDCDDGNPAIYPKARDTVSNGVDNNCDGVPGIDLDRDGLASGTSGGMDCDDMNPDVRDECWQDSALDAEPFRGKGPGFRIGPFAYLGESLFPGGLAELYYGITLGRVFALRIGAEYRLDYTNWGESKRGAWQEHEVVRDYQYLAHGMEGQLTALSIIRSASSSAFLLGAGFGIGPAYFADIQGKRYCFLEEEQDDPNFDPSYLCHDWIEEDEVIREVDALATCFSGHALLGIVPASSRIHIPIELDISLRACPALRETEIVAARGMHPGLLFGVGLVLGMQP